MTKNDYQNQLEKIQLEKLIDSPEWLLKLLKPDIYKIRLSFNKITAVLYKKDGLKQTHEVLADFSNSRMIVADFELGEQAVVELFIKFKKRNRLFNLVYIDVVENLEDGLTKIEQKVIFEMFMVGVMKAKMQANRPMIGYQGKFSKKINITANRVMW